MTLIWPLELLWFERLAASGSVLIPHCMACALIVRLCPTLHWSLKNDLGMAFGASLVWTSCSIRKRLVSSARIVRLCLTLHSTWVRQKPKIQPALELSSVQPKPSFGIGNWNQGPILVSVSESIFFFQNRFFFSNFFFLVFFCFLGL